ncbi:AMP-binding protein [Streptomyces sp. B21-106]
MVQPVQGLPRRLPAHNHYGPTETTVGVLCGEATASTTWPPGIQRPAGHPDATRARLRPGPPCAGRVPVGVPGELWIGGSSVSHGYLSPTEDQSARFVADPFSPDPSGRMYRTGDKARLLPDHTVEFLGRVDRQIKLRGFRVELGEIEAVMRQHPRVTGSLVVEAGESTGAHLVGYLIDAEGGRGGAEWLREFLAERLPDFMLPAHLVALDAFPLTSTGKIDASMLPEPGFYTQGSTTYVAPGPRPSAGRRHRRAAPAAASGRRRRRLLRGGRALAARDPAGRPAAGRLQGEFQAAQPLRVPRRVGARRVHRPAPREESGRRMLTQTTDTGTNGRFGRAREVRRGHQRDAGPRSPR